MVQQLFFDLDFSAAAAPHDSPGARATHLLLQRAVLSWFEQTEPPTGIAANVVTRISRLRADVAAFWSRPRRNPNEEGPSQILTPVRTAIVQCHGERESCWPDCIRSGEILPRLTELKAELADLEALIRHDEPHLRDTNSLFEEYAEWHYEKSGNNRYHHLRRTVEKLEHGLYNGTKFERIRTAQVADHLYLAVPKGMFQKSELADGWGLLWIHDDLSVTLEHEPEDRDCLLPNRVHLVQNIAAAARPHELMYHGIRIAGDKVTFVRPMRRTRSRENPRLPQA